jgi:hypothetical protein
MPSSKQPPLKSLHPDDSLIASKLSIFDTMSSEQLVASLALGQKDCLKARPDGTMLDGHHRICVLRKRKFDVDALPREIVLKETD